jgi:hypothetical protein
MKRREFLKAAAVTAIAPALILPKKDKLVWQDNKGNKIYHNPLGIHFCVIPYGYKCVCNHSHSIAVGIEAQTHEPYEHVVRYADGREFRRKLTHEEWVELYLRNVPYDYFEKRSNTPELIEKELERIGCKCREQYGKIL